MSVARTWPLGPTRRAAARVCTPPPAATSSTRLPVVTFAASSIFSVAGPSHVSSTGLQRFQASAASSHCCRVVDLYWTESKVMTPSHRSAPAVPDDVGEREVRSSCGESCYRCQATSKSAEVVNSYQLAGQHRRPRPATTPSKPVRKLCVLPEHLVLAHRSPLEADHHDGG